DRLCRRGWRVRVQRRGGSFGQPLRRDRISQRQVDSGEAGRREGMSEGVNGPERRVRSIPPFSLFPEVLTSPALRLAIAVVLIGAVLLLVKGSVAMGQTTLNGLVSAGYYALGAVGLTLIFG